jgi:hypothetical protein
MVREPAGAFAPVSAASLGTAFHDAVAPKAVEAFIARCFQAAGTELAKYRPEACDRFLHKLGADLFTDALHHSRDFVQE